MSSKVLKVAVGVLLVGLIFDYLLYQVFLHDSLARDPVLRVAEEGPWPKIPIGELLFALTVAWIYMRGVDARPPLGQGLRFGLALGFLAVAAGLQVAPMVGASETIIIGSIAGNAVKALAQGITAAVLAGPGPAL